MYERLMWWIIAAAKVRAHVNDVEGKRHSVDSGRSEPCRDAFIETSIQKEIKPETETEFAGREDEISRTKCAVSTGRAGNRQRHRLA